MVTAWPFPFAYPDNGHPLEDAALLRNAVEFATAQRAFSASRLLELPLDRLNQEALNYSVIDAYCAEMTASEDALGWLFTLRDWQPGTASDGLFALLDRIQVGVGRWTEADARESLEGLDAEAFRRMVHIPTDEELASVGVAADIRDAITRSLPAHLGGFRRIVELREASSRGYVVGFNKLKHLMLAMPTIERGEPEIHIPQWMKRAPDGTKYEIQRDGIHVQSLWIEASAKHVRLLANRAIISSAVLNWLLGTIWMTRFGGSYETPDWVLATRNLSGWLPEDTDHPLGSGPVDT